MRWNPRDDGSGLELFGWTLVVLAVIGALHVVGWIVLGVWGVWKWIS